MNVMIKELRDILSVLVHLKAAINQAAIWDNLQNYVSLLCKCVSLVGNKQHHQQVMDNEQKQHFEWMNP